MRHVFSTNNRSREQDFPETFGRCGLALVASKPNPDARHYDRVEPGRYLAGSLQGSAFAIHRLLVRANINSPVQAAIFAKKIQMASVRIKRIHFERVGFRHRRSRKVTVGLKNARHLAERFKDSRQTKAFSGDGTDDGQQTSWPSAADVWQHREPDDCGCFC